jgi:hypothetical protein
MKIKAAEFWELGLQPHPVSAISGSGTGELLDALAAVLPPPTSTEAEAADAKPPLAVAIVGRPNVGEFFVFCVVVCVLTRGGVHVCGRARGGRRRAPVGET